MRRCSCFWRPSRALRALLRRQSSRLTSTGISCARALNTRASSAVLAIDPVNPLQRATEIDRRLPGKPKARQKMGRFGYLPLMGETERGCKKPACCSLSLALRASVSKSLLRLLELVPDLPKSGDQLASKRSIPLNPKAYRKAHSILFRDPLISLGGCLRPSCARPLGGRASPRLLGIASSGCLPSCLRRGTPTRPRLCTPAACTS